MKKTLFTLFTIIGLTAFAQQEAPPHGINYQAVVYSDNGNNQPGLNNPGQVLWNKDITLRFAVYQGEDNPILVYEELHAITTDEFGMVSLVIGQGVPQGTQLFETINWGGGSHFLRVDVDKNAGVNFAPMSYQKLWSVPYALYSEQSNSSNYSDSSDYSNLAGNGITGVADNGDGTLTFTYFDGSSYTTPVLSGMEGPQGEIGPEGPAGIDGQDGLSAYEVWISQGNTGTEQDFLNGVIGPQGPAGNDGVNGIDGTDGQNGQDGLSAYETWLSQGNTGTEADFLNGITGPQGPVGTNGVDGTNGQDGQDGSSAYEIWLAQGNTGTEADFINGITGPAGNDGVDGVDGLSAYEVWLAQGNTGSEADFLTGITGPQGIPGVGVAQTISQTGNIATLSDGGGTININDTDSDSSNEFQTLSLSNDTLYLSNGNAVYLGNTAGGGSSLGPSLPSWINNTGNCVTDSNFVSTGNFSLSGIQEYCNFTLNAGHTLTINSPSLILRVSDTLRIDGVIDGSAKVSGIGNGGGAGGGGGMNNSSGGTSTAGSSSIVSAFNVALGGAIGGCSCNTTPNCQGQPGGSISSQEAMWGVEFMSLFNGASGGRGSVGSSASCRDVAGGLGGAGLVIICNVLELNGTINLSGGNGQGETSSCYSYSCCYPSGGGGGGGGTCVINTGSVITNSNNIIVLGGNGGGAAGGCSSQGTPGGKGGDGTVLFITP